MSLPLELRRVDRGRETLDFFLMSSNSLVHVQKLLPRNGGWLQVACNLKDRSSRANRTILFLFSNGRSIVKTIVSSLQNIYLWRECCEYRVIVKLCSYHLLSYDILTIHCFESFIPLISIQECNNLSNKCDKPLITLLSFENKVINPLIAC